MPAFLLLLKALFTLLVQAWQLPCELTGLEGEKLSPHGFHADSLWPLFQHIACLKAPSHAASFRLWPPRGMAGPEPPVWSPENHTEGPLGLPRTKNCQLSGMNLSSSPMAAASFPGRRCYFCITFSSPGFCKTSEVSAFMETVIGCLRYSIY